MSTRSQRFDIIICGAGSSGLGLAYQLSYLDHSFSIALVDSSFSTSQNKTWCFWDNVSIPDPNLILHQWKNVSILTSREKFDQSLNTHSYYCIQNTDYRAYILNHLKSDNRFTLIENQITSIEEDFVSKKGIVSLSTHPTLQSNYIFDSTPKDWSKYVQPKSNMLFQHFVGWEIETKHDCFDPFTARLMDFRTSQEFGFAFVYVLPFSKKHALIELTYFSKNVLDHSHYPIHIKKYLKDYFNIEQNNSDNLSSFQSNATFQVTKTESGVIPMIDLALTSKHSNTIYDIGLAGGLAKPSTGYAFSRIQRDVKKIAENLVANTPISRSKSPFKFRFYDMLILDIISKYPDKAINIFMQLFQKNGFDMMFKFLDEKTSLVEDLKIMASVPSYNDFFKAIAQTSSKMNKL